MSILKLGTNSPVQIALKYRSAKEANGKWGMQYLYTLSTGDILYLPPVAHDLVKALNPAPGEAFLLEKTITAGNAIAWSVERVSHPPQPVPAPVAISKSVTRAAASSPSLTTPQSQQLFRQLVATIEAVRAAEEFSISIDRPVKFESQDIRALAISSFIEQSKRAAA